MGNAWKPGLPVMSTLAIESLIAFKKAADLHLCQEFVWYNNAKLPTPAQWVTINRVRVKDAFTRLWWLSPTPNPKADNRRVLVPYSKSMRRLLKNQRYNAGKRPSEHVISEKGFLKDHGGAIASNVLDYENHVPESLIVGSNTESTDPYHAYCRSKDIVPHPARMPLGLATFFVRLCTESGDLVLDPFAGSNTTGAAAEQSGTPPLWEPALVDEILAVSTADANDMTRRIAREEALFAGTSSGANVVAAIQVAKRLGAGAKVVTLMADSGLKYLSTDVYGRNR